MSSPVTMTRQELYDLVWSKPMRDAAAAIPMSDVGLKKACVRLNVPVPAQGYWNKVQAGYRLKQRPLPPLTPGQLDRATFAGVRPRASEDLVLRRDQAKAALQAGAPASFRSDVECHGCTRRTAAALKKVGPDRRGALKVGGSGIANLNVSTEMAGRALMLLDDLFRYVEKLGYSVAEHSSPAALAIDGVQVGVSIAETFKRTNAPPDAAEVARRNAFERRNAKQVALLRYDDPWMYRPSGKLTVTLSGASWEPGLRSVWVEKGIRRIESRIDEIAVEAVAHAAAMKKQREELKRQEEHREEIERQREKRAAEEAEEERRIEFLEERASWLDDAERMARVVGNVRRTMGGTPSDRLAAFLEWADQHIAHLRECCSAEGVDDDLRDSDL
jgi:hypothetical protein